MNRFKFISILAYALSFFLATYYLKENWVKVHTGFEWIRFFAKYESSSHSNLHLTGLTSEKEDYNALESLNPSEMLLRNLRQGYKHSQSSHEIHLNSHLKKVYESLESQPLKFPCSGYSCQGLLITLPKDLEQNPIKFQMNMEESFEDKAVFFLYSEATVHEVADTGWNFFDHNLHVEAENGDLIFVDGVFDFQVKVEEKQARVAHNRSIFPGVGGWPGMGKRVGVLTPRFVRNPDPEKRMDFGSFIRIQNNSLYFIAPKRDRIQKIFIGTRTEKASEFPFAKISLHTVNDETLSINALSLSPLEFDFAVNLLDNHRCEDVSLNCLQSLMQKELLSQL